MCGRYASTTSRKTLLETFEIDPEPADPEIAQDYNVAPTKTSPVVVARTPKDTGDDLRRSAHQESFSNSSTSWRILMTCMANDSHRAGPHEIG
jgi:putative SOS response-associated peptidase YedK